MPEIPSFLNNISPLSSYIKSSFKYKYILALLLLPTHSLLIFSLTFIGHNTPNNSS